ncbi:MAG: hypothetical protein A2Z14_10995 [Chloroflexi bacterium RBG_16_48_8]|nr:MAG: hypothetical protein A2Z14_10995 [Chloroflexi bacterium RBG_16_48_8]
MNTLNNSLRAITRFPFLLSIGLLLVNDHVLKNCAPSFLTGKLSDFAGLFFFPILLTALLGLLLEPLGFSCGCISRISFGMTLVCFSLIKTIPMANYWTNQLLVALFRSPTEIMIDPTDLTALAVLWPASRLWRSTVYSLDPYTPSRKAYLSIAVATLATLATSPCRPTISRIERLAVVEDVIYARISYSDDEQMISPSKDGGKTWEWISEDIPPNVISELGQKAQLPLTRCLKADLQMCYRVAGKEEVEASIDGGKTWQVVWHIPYGRRYYIERILSQADECDKQVVEMGPFDLAILEKVDKHTVIVAMGTEGVLIRTEAGEWEQHAVLDAGPIPFYAKGLEIDIIRVETGIALLYGFLLLGGLSIWGWASIKNSPQAHPAYDRNWAVRPALRMTILVLILTVLGGLGLSKLSGIYSFIELTLFPIPMAIAILGILFSAGIYAAWMRFKSLMPHPDLAMRSWWASVLVAIASFIAVWLSFELWVIGTISVYRTALSISLAFALFFSSLGVYLVWRIGKS